MTDKWINVATSLLNEEERLEEQTKVFRRTRAITMKEMSKELPIQKIAKLFKVSRQRVYKILESEDNNA
jgi:DNA invertase Pin-like site-specific DNA recombinase